MVNEPAVDRPQDQPAGGSDRRWTLSLAVLFLSALAVRLVYLWQFRRSPFFGVLLGDCARYDAWARAIAGGDWLGSGVFFQAPLYPYFLAAIYRLLADDVVTVLLVQIVLGAAATVHLALAAQNFFGRAAGLRAGLLLALYPSALFFDHLLQKSSLDLYLLCLFLHLLSRAVEGGGGRWLAAGLAAGALALTRENALVLIVCVLAWIVHQRGAEPRRRRAATAARFLAGVAIVLLPVGLRNHMVGGEFLLTTSQGGVNLWIGNNPAADGVYRPLVAGRGSIRFEAEDARLVAARDLGGDLSAREASRHWTRKTLRWIRDEPGAWLRLMGRKARLLVNRVEIMDTEDQYSRHDAVPIARWLGWVLHFGVLLPLAVLGALATWRHPGAERRRLLALLVLGYAASVWIFFVLDRYRHPLVPLLALYAGAGLAYADSLRRRSPRVLAGIGAAVLAAALAANWPAYSVREMQALSHANLGTHLGERGRYAEAVRHFRTSLRLRPASASTRFNLGLFLARAGDLESSAAALARAVELDPTHFKATAELGRVLAGLGRLDAAAGAYERALELEPANAATHDRLGLVYARQGRFAAAEASFARALELDPGSASAIDHLARARGELERLLLAGPGDPAREKPSEGAGER